MTCSFLVALPGWLLGLLHIASLTLPILLLATRKKGVGLFIEDLRIHRMERRGLFQHSEDCYMTGGDVACFVKKRREKLRGKSAGCQGLTSPSSI